MPDHEQELIDENRALRASVKELEERLESQLATGSHADIEDHGERRASQAAGRETNESATELAKRLEASQARLIAAQRLAKIGDFTWDVENGEVMWSDSLFELLGYGKTDKIDYSLVKTRIHHPEDEARVAQWLQDAIDSGNAELPPNEHRLVCKDGHFIHVYVVGTIQRKPGESTRVFGTVQDITERKQAEAETQKLTAFLDRVVDLSPFAMWVANPEGTVFRTNRTLRDTLNLTDEQIVGKYNVLKDTNLVQQGVMPAVKAVFDRHEPARFSIPWVPAAAGDVDFTGGHDLDIDVALFPILDTAGQLMNVVCQWVDVTEGKRAEEERESLAKFPSENPNPVLRIAADGVVLYSNEAAAEVLASWKTALHRSVPERWQQVVAQALKIGTDVLEEERIGERLFSFSVAPIKEGHYVNLYGRDITERRRAVNQLRESEAKYRLLFENAGVFVSSWDAGGRCLLMNKHVAQSFGGQPAELVGKSFEELHPDKASEYTARIREVIDTGVSREYEDLVQFPTGPRWLLSNVHSIVNECGIVEAAQIISQDITDRKQAEEELRKIEWLLTKSAPSEPTEEECQPAYGDVTELNTSRVILDSVGTETLRDIAADLMSLLGTSVAVYERNGDYAFGMFESGWCRLMDQASRDLCHTDDNARALACGKWVCHEDCWNNSAKPAIETGQPTDIECVGGIRLYAMPIHAGGEVVGAINVGYQAPPTEAGKLKELAEKYAVDAEALRKEALAYEQRPKYVVEMAKERVASSARLMGEIVERQRAEEQARETHRRLLLHEEREKERVETELEKVREELIRKTRLAAIGQVSGSIAHELRNPLGAVRNAAFYLKRHAPKDQPKTTQFLQIIEDQVARADKIISSLLGMTRFKEPATESVTLRPIVEEVLAQMEGIEGIRWTIETNPDPFLLLADAEQLRQVVTNLIDNSVEAMNGEGDLTIEASRDETADTIVFRDSGPGVLPDVRDSLFEPLVTSKTTGTGLGLAICRQIVERHGGTIELLDDDRPGAAFCISLPRGQSPEENHS